MIKINKQDLQEIQDDLTTEKISVFLEKESEDFILIELIKNKRNFDYIYKKIYIKIDYLKTKKEILKEARERFKNMKWEKR